MSHLDIYSIKYRTFSQYFIKLNLISNISWYSILKGNSSQTKMVRQPGSALGLPVAHICAIGSIEVSFWNGRFLYIFETRILCVYDASFPSGHPSGS